MDLWIGLAAVIVNIVFVATLLSLEKWYSDRGGIRPRDKKFFYLVDYKTIAWGDTVGLSLLNFGVFASWGNELFRIPGLLTVFLVVGLASTWFAQRIWMAPGHPPSLTYSDSASAMIVNGLHLAYFFAQITIGLAALGLIVSYSAALVPELFILAGMAVYAIFLGVDAADGKF